ncbi:MAG: PQQ-binding-like beta-propeller repeat protein [Planctomycetota bacterium]
MNARANAASRPPRRGLLAAAAAAVFAVAATAQLPPRRVVEAPIDFTTGQDDNLFSVLRSQELIHALEQGLAEVAAGEVRTGVERLHRILAGDAPGVVPVAPGRFLGLRLAATMALANLPPAARAASEEFVERAAGAAPDLATLDAPALRRLADRFPTASVGVRARLLLGDLALADGDARAAVGHFRQALDAVAIGSADERRAAERLFCAQTLVEPAVAAGERRVGRLGAIGEDVLGVLPPDRLLRQGWPAVGGPGSGRTAMAEPPRRVDTRWSAEVAAPCFDEREVSQYAMHAIGDLDAIFVNTGRQVLAFDPLRKEQLWDTVSPMREVDDPAPLDSPFGRRRRGMGSDDGVNEDSTLAAAVGDDVVVAALQVPEKSMNVDFQGGFRVMSKIPMRRLHGFHRATGKVAWTHYDDLDGPRTRRFRGHDACGAPLVVGELGYAPVHDRSGAIAFSIAAYDLRTGEVRWRRLVCSGQQDVNMFGNARSEFAASPLALHDGVLYGASNLGVAFAIEAATGDLRWLASYEVVRMPRVSFHQQPERQVFFANNPPAVADGVVCMTPLDSQFVLGLDAQNGALLWRVPAEATVDDVDHRVTWLCGAWRDEFVLAGWGAVAASARPRQGADTQLRTIVRPDRFGGGRAAGNFAPRPALTTEAVWFVRPDGLHGFDAQGAAVPGTPTPLGRIAPGNLVCIDGIAVSLRQGTIDFAYDAAALRRRVDDEAKQRPDDPAVLLRLASLRRSLLPHDAGVEQRAAVTDVYRRGLAAAQRRGLPPDHPVREALQRELFGQALATAQQALLTGGDGALTLLAAARDLAPDDARWADVHVFVLDLCRRDSGRFASELDALLARMPGGDCPRVLFPLPRGRQLTFDDRMPVATFVAWHKAIAAAAPATAVARWQELLEGHGPQPLVGGAAADVASAAIDALVRAHGRECYAATEARAGHALAAAGDDRAALAAIAGRFPNSAAAGAARTRLLDAAVRAGDLGAALATLASAAATGEPPPGLLRRVQIAARTRGNGALAAALAARLRSHAATPSDWPDDGGATYGQLAAAGEPPAVPAVLPDTPLQDALLVRPPAGSDVLHLLPLLIADGFQGAATPPVYLRGERELLAIDPAAKEPEQRQLFALPIDFAEHVILCGDTLVVPEMDKVTGVDCRTGAIRWQFANPQRRMLESLGVESGILLVTANPRAGVGSGEVLGIEPLSGTLTFRRVCAADALKPKAVGGSVVGMDFADGEAATVRRIDPITGATTATWPLRHPSVQRLRPDVDALALRFYPQSLLTHGSLLLLPLDRALAGDAPRVVALAPDGEQAWQWQAAAATQLVMAAMRGDDLVLVVADAAGACRVLLLDPDTGAERRAVPVGFDATPRNWQRSWLDEPAPERLLLDSFADADRTERQVVSVECRTAGSAFALPLTREDGELIGAPVHGADFLAFATRPARGGGCRLWCVSLQDRSGMLPNGRRYRTVAGAGNVDAMAALGRHIAVAGSRGVVLFAADRGPR